MSLTFGAATSDRVDCGSAASLENLDVCTYLAIVKPTTLTDLRHIASKRLATTPFGARGLRITGTGGNLRVYVDRVTANLDYRTSDTPLSVLNTWYLVAGAWDLSATAGNLASIFAGPLGGVITTRTLGTTTDGSGASETEAGGSFHIGNTNTSTPNTSFRGDIARVAVFGRRFTLEEVILWQYSPLSLANCLGLWELGYNSTGTQPDLSGNGNTGTVTGTTVSGHAPITIIGPNRRQPSIYATVTGADYTKDLTSAGANSGGISELDISLNSLHGASLNSSLLQRLIGRLVSGTSSNVGTLSNNLIPGGGGGSTYFQDGLATSDNAGILQVKLNPGLTTISTYVQRLGYWLRRRFR